MSLKVLALQSSILSYHFLSNFHHFRILPVGEYLFLPLLLPILISFPGNLSQPNDFSNRLLDNLADLQGVKPYIRVGGNTQ